MSPGPYGPEASGVCVSLPTALPETPVLGVCLGHLAMAEAYGGATVRAQTPIHGQATPIHHEGDGILAGLPTPFEAGRYHALISDISGTELLPTAWSSGGELMAFRHAARPHFGVQFHPESVLTPDGRSIIANFLETVRT